MIPQILDDWTYEVLRELVDNNICEGDTFDFKVSLDDKSHRLLITACSFANTSWWFIIFGIKDLCWSWRIDGIDSNSELAKIFWDKINNSEPTIYFTAPKIIQIPETNKVVAIFYIPPSPTKPHVPMTNDYKNNTFYKRTNKWNDPMSYNEIRLAFIQNEEKRRKVELLYSELTTLKEDLVWIIDYQVNWNEHVPIVHNPTIIHELFIESYSILYPIKEYITKPMNTLIKGLGKLQILIQQFLLASSSIGFDKEWWFITHHEHMRKYSQELLKPLNILIQNLNQFTE